MVSLRRKNELIAKFRRLYKAIRNGTYTNEDLDEAIRVGEELIMIHDKENDIVGGILMRIITWSLKQMKGRLGDGVRH